MTYICYERKRFTEAHLEVIAKANSVLEDYANQGFTLTVRQLYYQFVSKNWIRNKQSEYTRLAGIINDARLAGLMSWTAIEDRGRSLKGVNTFDGPRDLIKQSLSKYAIDLWANQEWRPEVWVEKQALEGVIGGICGRLRVDFYSTKGYNSQSEQWRAGRRFASYYNKGQKPIVFHLGDHDPSGIDMTRDNRDRLSLFAGVPVTVVRLALNMNQVEEYNPPPNPVKLTDSRTEGYREQYGDSSWELDALSPKVISDLIEQNVLKVRNSQRWDEAVQQETEDRMQLEMILESFE